MRRGPARSIRGARAPASLKLAALWRYKILLVGIRGARAPASLKPGADEAGIPCNPPYPGRARPGLIEACVAIRPIRPDSAYPGRARPGLIEARRK